MNKNLIKILDKFIVPLLIAMTLAMTKAAFSTYENVKMLNTELLSIKSDVAALKNDINTMKGQSVSQAEFARSIELLTTRMALYMGNRKP